MISIIGGLKKRTSLHFDPSVTRPTSAKKREAIFSIITSHELKTKNEVYKKQNILDLFAGSGALGVEALSRGANFGYFYENNIEACKNIEKNCLKIFEKTKFKIIKQNILTNYFTEINKKISLVFLDPPYNINPFHKILVNIIKANILTKNAMIVIESDYNSKIVFPDFFSYLVVRKYGKSKITFLVKKS